MIFVRGIVGDIELNSFIKLWGGLALLVAGAIWALLAQFADYRRDVESCRARNGVGVGGMPIRVGAFRSMKGRCDGRKQGDNW